MSGKLSEGQVLSIEQYFSKLRQQILGRGLVGARP